MVDVSQVVQAVLFALFAVLTSALWGVTAPTYDNLLVPELLPSAAYPPIFPSGGAPPSFLTLAARFSAYLVANVVDPAVVLVALALGAVYLARAVTSPARVRLESLLPRLVVAVVLANVTVPVAGAIFELAGAVYPVVAGFDGGAWQSWTNLTGFGGLKFSWDNGLLAFVLSFAMFSLVLLLALAVAARNAMLAVLLVLLPAFSLLLPIPALEPLARRSWMLFGELAFLPVVLVVPLELAVGSPSILVLVAYLAIALGAPSLIDLAGGQLGRLGFPSAGGALTGGIERGLSVATLGMASVARPITATRRTGGRGSAAASAASSVARVPLPFTAPLLAAEGIGRGAEAMFRHVKDARLAIASRRFGGLDRDHPEPLSELR
jgi:hypothetical protein